MTYQRSFFQPCKKRKNDTELCKTKYVENKTKRPTIGERYFEVPMEIERGNTRFIFK